MGYLAMGKNNLRDINTLLGLLLGILTGGFLLLFAQDYYFHQRLDFFERQIINERNLVQISAFIQSREKDLRLCMDEFLSRDSQVHRSFLYQQIDRTHTGITHALRVIEQGGSVTVTHNDNGAGAPAVEHLYYRPVPPFIEKKELVHLRQLFNEMDQRIDSLFGLSGREQSFNKQETGVRLSKDALHRYLPGLQQSFDRLEGESDHIYTAAVLRLQQLEKIKHNERKIFVYWSLASGIVISATTILLAFFVSTRIRKIQQDKDMQQQRFRTVADQSYAWEYWIDPEGKFEYISPSCERISGYPPAAFIQDPDLLTTIVIAEDREKFLRHLKTREKECSFLTFQIITRTGEKRWIQHTCRTVVDKQGRCLGRRGSNIDYTDQYRAEQRIIASRRQWVDTFDAIPDSVMLLDREFRIKKMNRATAEILGCSISQLLGEVCYKEFHCSRHPTKNCPLMDLFSDGLSHEEEVYIERLDRYFNIVVSPLVDDNGQVTGAVHVARDITRQRKAESARQELMATLETRVAQRTVQLQQAYSDLEQIFEVALPLVVVKGDFVIDRVNRAFCRFFKIRKELVVGRHCYELWDGEFCHGKDCTLQQLQSGVSSVDRHFDGITLQGQRVTCSIHSVPYHDAAGNFAGQISSFFDFSERKRVEQRLEKMRRQLLHVEKLNAIGSLSASIAHEFNNPLCGVLSVLERLHRDPRLKKVDREMVSIALREGDRMKRLITDLQNFNRPTSGRTSIFDLHSVLESMVVFIQKEMSIHGIVLLREYSDESIVIEAVEDQIKQVILNLLKNAVEAIGDAGGEIRLQTVLHDTEVEIKITDNGSGLKAEDLPRVFEPFFTTKLSGKGTGLGLSVSYGIVKAHGGTIEVQVRAEKGSVFTVKLPIGSTINKRKSV